LNFNDLLMTGVVFGDENAVPILGLHGWLDNAASFSMLAPQLTDRKVIALDFIGHGKSSHRNASQPYYLWDNVVDVYCALDELGIDKIDIMGHSMGASVAMLFAACFPERVGQLYLIEGLAPLNYPANELPQLMAKAIRKRIAVKGREARAQKDLSKLITARANGRFPLSQYAATLLVERGVTKESDGYRWSSDAALLLPSINRMDEAQIVAFLQSLKMNVSLYLADEGLVDDQWRKYFDYVPQLQVYTFRGNHHLHLQEHGAIQIAQAMVDNPSLR